MSDPTPENPVPPATPPANPSTPPTPPPTAPPTAPPAAPQQPQQPQQQTAAYPPPPSYGEQNAAPQGYPGQTGYAPPTYPGSGYTPYPAAPKTNVLAIVSLIASIANFVILPFVGALAGVITGHISLKQLKTSGENGRGMALAGTIVGWVGLALSILGIIAVILYFTWFFTMIESTGGYYDYS
ncbi:DUF4190 domain-containing protein [Microbacterium caowuchunii]|uniref:DUF4190 domain-containing protein n=1 Tax=Microbacterium caowuchunii TaxID=2614638 RepID=UPI001244B7A2|nr:DUF4190 domain-containing protein [Microbacterium caowuchunii]QEV99938.1 DUF4190 domain-containing protein [Microbacterium caowuchunii]